MGHPNDPYIDLIPFDVVLEISRYSIYVVHDA